MNEQERKLLTDLALHLQTVLQAPEFEGRYKGLARKIGNLRRKVIESGKAEQ